MNTHCALWQVKWCAAFWLMQRIERNVKQAVHAATRFSNHQNGIPCQLSLYFPNQWLTCPVWTRRVLGSNFGQATRYPVLIVVYLSLSRIVRECLTSIQTLISLLLKASEEPRIYLHGKLISKLDTHEWPPSFSGRFNPEKSLQYPSNRRHLLLLSEMESPIVHPTALSLYWLSYPDSLSNKNGGIA